MTGTSNRQDWKFLSNHAHVLLCISRDPDVRLRDIAVAVGLTERAVQRIVAELERAGVLVRERRGRRCHYRVCRDTALGQPLERRLTAGEVIGFLE